MFNFTVGFPPMWGYAWSCNLPLKFCLDWVHTIQTTEVKEVGFTAGRNSRRDKKTKDQKGEKIHYSDFSVSSQP